MVEMCPDELSFNSSENVISTTELTESIKSISSTANENFTPELSSSKTSSSRDSEPPMPTNHYAPTFVTPNSVAAAAFDKSDESSEVTLPPPATGRAVDYRPAYPFSQLLTPNSKGYNRPSAGSYPPVRSRPASRPNTPPAHRVVYPSYQASRTPSRAEIDKLSGKGQDPDRSTPTDAVKSKPPNSYSTGMPTNPEQSSIPPSDFLPSNVYPSDSLPFNAPLPIKLQSRDQSDSRKIEVKDDYEVINYGRAFNLPESSILGKMLEAFSEARAAEGRVKKYSYFYIAHSLWYMPLHFSVWLSFYILWLMYKSIAYHVSMLPNNYKLRVPSRSFSDIDQREVRQIIDKLTIVVMVGIEKYKELNSH